MALQLDKFHGSLQEGQINKDQQEFIQIMKKRKVDPNIFKPCMFKRQAERRNSDHELFVQNAKEEITKQNIFPIMNKQMRSM